MKASPDECFFICNEKGFKINLIIENKNMNAGFELSLRTSHFAK